MKITYRTAEGTIELDVAEEVAVTLETSYREEENLERKCRYHNYSIDAIDYEGLEYADPNTTEGLILEAESSAYLQEALNQLTDVQRKRLLKLASGMSLREIAEQEGTAHRTIADSIDWARKKLKKILKDDLTD